MVPRTSDTRVHASTIPAAAQVVQVGERVLGVCWSLVAVLSTIRRFRSTLHASLDAYDVQLLSPGRVGPWTPVPVPGSRISLYLTHKAQPELSIRNFSLLSSTP